MVPESAPVLERLAAGGRDAGCESCAYRKGSETRHEPTNLIRATVCADAGVPFLCHVRSGVMRLSESGKPIICEGWKAEVAERAKNPEWREHRSVKRALGEYSLQLIDQLCGLPPGTQHDLVLVRVKEAMRMLYERKPLKLRRPM